MRKPFHRPYIPALLSDGIHEFTYSARDKSGNTATCTVRLEVKVDLCDAVSQPLHGYHTCSTQHGTPYGNACQYRCSDGYEFEGGISQPFVRTCVQKTKTTVGWNDDPPSCKKIRCPELNRPEYGNLTCTDGMFYGSTCTFVCQPGYSLPPGQSPDLWCLKSRWTSKAPEKCIDSESPRFLDCPSENLVFTAAPNKTSAVVDWPIPNATDNALYPPTVEDSPLRESVQDAGYYPTEHTAIDAGGNQATCRLYIIVKVLSCDTLPVSEGLRAICSHGTRLGSFCTFSCGLGYRLEGDRTTVCQGDAAWLNEPPTCVEISCEPAPAIQNGFYAEGANYPVYGSSARYECNDGYKIKNEVIRCVSERNSEMAFWEGGTPACLVETCDRPPLHGIMTVAEGTTCEINTEVPYNESCEFDCIEGYVLKGPSTLQCGQDERWLQQTLPSCEVIRCSGSALPSPVNGGKNGCPLSSERYGTECTLYCNVGYAPLQPVTRTCLADKDNKGYWSDGGSITCSVVKCHPLVKPVNGFIESCSLDGNSVNVTSTEQTYNTRCQTACNPGYTARHSLTRRCLEDGTWEGVDQICEDETPPSLDCPIDQIIVAGANKLEAIFSGDNWEPITAHDGDIQFEASLHQVDSHVVVDGNIPTTLSEGDHTLVYKANDFAGNSATCHFNLEVKVTRCLPLYPPAGGSVALIVGHGACESGAVFGSECGVSCDEGYLLSEADEENDVSFVIACNRTDPAATLGAWTNPVPSCKLIQCQIPLVTNGTVSGCPSGTADYGDECLFRCHDGFKSSNGKRSVYRACQADGTFSGDEFHCDVPITCAPLSIPTDGSLSPESCSEVSQVPFGTTCLYACDTGFLHDGPFQKTCLSTGTWNNDRAVSCRDNQAPVFDPPCPLYVEHNAERGTSSAVMKVDTPLASDNSGNVTVHLESNPPSEMRFPEGTTRLRFTASDPSNNVASCDVYIRITVFRCLRLQAPHHGSVVNCSDPVYGSECDFFCNEGYQISGPNTRTCEVNSGQASAYWDGSQPTCEPNTCPAYPMPANGVRSGCSQDPPNTETFGTQCGLFCLYGFEPVGDASPSCQADGTWSSDNFTCKATSCNKLLPQEGSAVIPAECMSSPVFGQQCVVSCDRSGYRLQPSNFAVVECQGNGQWTPGDLSPVICADIEDPEFTSCFEDITIFAERRELRANVTWNVTAVDNSGEDPLVSCDQEMGEVAEGDLRVRCTAEDAAGNSRTCSFEVSVEIRRCHSYVLPARGSFEGSCDTHWGSTCHVTCVSGYHLAGSSNVTCEFDGTRMYWAEDEVPMCEAYRCNPLELPDNVDVNPTTCSGPSEVHIGTTCRPYCSRGRTLEGDDSVIICGADGHWSRDVVTSSNISCRDLTAPTLTSCPAPITATQTESWGVEVAFDIPSATDSADTNLEVLKSPPDLTSPYNFTQDTVCSYTFKDNANNSVSCQFHVYVKDDLAPVVVYCPPDQSLNSSQQTTVVSWNPPIFEEVTGDELEISSTYDGYSAELRYGDHLVIYTATNTDNQRTTTCSFTISVQPIPCLSLEPPVNGALACDGFAQATFCSILCNAKYDIARSTLTIEDQYVCGNSGEWQPHAIVPDCTETRRATRANLPNTLQYFSGSCGSSETSAQIAEAFLQLLQESLYYSVTCTPDVECTVENVEVICGPYDDGARRKRWSVDEHSGWRRSRSSVTNRWKRTAEVEPSEYVFTINFGMGIAVDQSGSASDFDATLDAEEMLIDHVYAALEENRLDLSNISSEINITLTVDDDTYDFGFAELLCNPPYTANNDVYHCVPCGPGFYFDNTTMSCSQCEKGSYQSRVAQFTCDQCSKEQSTLELGSRNITQCIDICQPGFSSETGLEPCYRCGIGAYQNSSFGTECFKCPEGMTTRHKGSNSSDECIEPCKAGEFSDSGFAPCSPCPVGSYQSLVQRTQCIQCPDNTTTRGNGTTSPIQCISACDSGPCQNGGFCISGGNEYRCTCQAGYTGKDCHTEVDECFSNPCINGATCSDHLYGFLCICARGYEGVNCENEIDYCLSTPCENNAPCTSVLGDFECSCPFGFSGKNCSTEVDLCAGDPCKNGATCFQSQQAVSGYLCQCALGYRGVNCSINIDECQSSPCLNHGSCVDGINSYTCNCPFGFLGSRCEEDVDLCASVTCHNNGTCTEIGNRTFCACTANFIGEFCQEERNACSDITCLNGGTCTSTEGTSLAYICLCGPKYVGQHCETEVDFCRQEPCLNGAICIDGDTNYTCTCPIGFTGPECSVIVDWCKDAPCGVNSECLNEPQGFRCLCSAGWTGQYCLDEVNLCQELEPCSNGSTCTGDHASFVCHCPPGYQGRTCEEEIDNCSSAPCHNGGRCFTLVGSYLCECEDGFTGTHCETDIDDCETSPCEHGTCTDGIDTYTCECEVGYTGTHCETDIRCTNSPCRNGATCYIDRRRPRCFCAPGFTGRYCQSEINECRTQPCFEATKCIDGINSFTCVCKDGFTGSLCDSRVSRCQSSPSICQNGGTCHDRLDGGYSCQCLLGFEGNNCEVDIDDCMSNDCENGGTCVDGIHEYTCECAEGTWGTFCQLSASPCDSNPCKNGGQCDNDEHGFICYCLAGFTGETCSANVDDCVDHLCSDGSTCDDQVNGYQCICPDGMTGEHCDEDIDECENNPCQNGGTCIDGTAMYTCLCLSGFGGRDCEKEVDECASVPCANLGVCTDGIDNFECDCLEGYRGATCEERISACESSPCINNGSCTDGLIQFVCSCPRGFTGERCETEIVANFDFVLDESIRTVNHSSAAQGSHHNLTLSVWMQLHLSASSIDTRLLQLSAGDLRVTLVNPCNLTMIVGTRQQTDSHVSVCDGRWHHFLLRFHQSGQWAWQVDGSMLSQPDVDSEEVVINGIVHVMIGAADLHEDDIIQLSALHVWSGVVPSDIQSSLHTKCSSTASGDVIAWTDFVAHVAFNEAAVFPSACDDTNECMVLPSPCQNGGTCVDQLNAYSCLCPQYLTGKNCDTEVDLCTSTICQNGGTCTTLNRTTSCECPDLFIGSFCEISVVNGNWSEWTEWSPCSMPCDGGTWNRTRECVNPPPNDHGLPCEGHDLEEEACNTQKCPACTKIEPPENGFMQCETEGKSHNCTISCPEGFDFLGTVEPFVFCSPSTNYVWSHQNVLTNSRAKLPECQKTEKPAVITTNLRMPYPSVPCSSVEEEAELREAFTSTFSANIIHMGCPNIKTCPVSDLMVENCVSRKRREAEDSSVTVTFNALFNYTSGANTSDDEGLSVSELNTVFDTLMENGSFSVTTNGETHPVDSAGATGVAGIICPEGQGYTSQSHCAPCQAGMYQAFDSEDSVSYCTLCRLSSYQDQEGQTGCIACPDGLITMEFGSDNLTDCIVPCPTGHYQDIWADGPAPVCHACPLGMYQDQPGQMTCTVCPDGYTTLEEASTNITDCVVICDAGSYVDVSNASNPLCLACPVNSYLDQNGHHEQECIPCPDDMVTKGNGSTNATECIDACGSGSYWDVQISRCLPCPPDTYQKFHHHLEEACMPCPTGMVTGGNTSIDHHDCSYPTINPTASSISTGKDYVTIIVATTVIAFLLVVAILVGVGLACKFGGSNKKINRDMYLRRRSSVAPSPVSENREGAYENEYIMMSVASFSNVDEIRLKEPQDEDEFELVKENPESGPVPYCQTPVEPFTEDA